jgi:hypothetical protein
MIDQQNKNEYKDGDGSNCLLAAQKKKKNANSGVANSGTVVFGWIDLGVVKSNRGLVHKLSFFTSSNNAIILNTITNTALN